MSKKQKIVKVSQKGNIPIEMTKALEDGYLVVRSDVIPGFQIENPNSEYVAYVGFVVYILEKDDTEEK